MINWPPSNSRSLMEYDSPKKRKRKKRKKLQGPPPKSKPQSWIIRPMIKPSRPTLFSPSSVPHLRLHTLISLSWSSAFRICSSMPRLVSPVYSGGLLLSILFQFRLIFAQSCYFPDGTNATNHIPCNGTVSMSHCCEPGDTCLTTSLVR